MSTQGDHRECSEYPPLLRAKAGQVLRVLSQYVVLESTHRRHAHAWHGAPHSRGSRPTHPGPASVRRSGSPGTLRVPSEYPRSTLRECSHCGSTLVSTTVSAGIRGARGAESARDPRSSHAGAHADTHTHTLTLTLTHSHTTHTQHAHTHTPTQTHFKTHTCTNSLTHTHMHTHTQTHTHTPHMRVRLRRCTRAHKRTHSRTRLPQGTSCAMPRGVRRIASRS